MSKIPGTVLPSGMERKSHVTGFEGESGLPAWQRNTEQTIHRILEPRERRSGVTISTAGNTLRAVTPEEPRPDSSAGRPRTPIRTDTPFEIPASPRSIPGGEKPRDRRQGLVFDNSFDAPPDTSSPSQMISPYDPSGSPGRSVDARPRTRTLDDSQRSRQTTSTVSKSRHRIGSVHSTVASPWTSGNDAAASDSSPLRIIPSYTNPRTMPSQTFTPSKDKMGRKLQKKSSQSTSPLSSATPSSDSLTFPLPTSNANKILELMKTLEGRMRGPVEFQISPVTPWMSGLCYIDENRGALMSEGDDRGPFHSAILSDLRGCLVKPVLSMEKQMKCLEITEIGGAKLRLIPLLSTEFDYWLAAFLHWQQIRVGGSQISLSIPEGQHQQSETLSRATSSRSLKESSIIKVGKVLLWDRATPITPTATGGRGVKDNKSSKSSTPIKHPVQDQSNIAVAGSWQKVSCTLQDNGEFRLHSERDVVLLSVIQLSQLSRCAVQRLDRTVLGEEYCIAIFPKYTPTSTALSIIRPVYIALDQRVYFEVWYVLLRAFAIPELYGPQPMDSEENDSDYGYTDDYNGSSDMFRIHNSLSIRIIEAKIRKGTMKADTLHNTKHGSKAEQDLVNGDYYTEVILDGDLRAKTMVKQNTKNPFWREECDFRELPALLPELSFVLKRQLPIVEQSHGHRSTNNVHKTEHVTDMSCGVVTFKSGEKLEKGKEQESWWPIIDESGDQIGEMFLKLRHEELVVLLAKDYQPISELLHKFSNGLTMQLAQTLPGKLRQLSETFMNIFQVSGQANNWLMALVEDEIDGIGKEQPTSSKYRFSKRLGSNDSFDSVGERELSVRDLSKSLTGEANLLFRGNSLLTQSLDFHMRRLGKEYLEDVLRDKIEEIIEKDYDCEVDPSRLTHGEDMSKNWTQLINLTTGIWSSISASASKCPPALRQMLKFIRAVADDRYGDFLRTVPYTSVSGFLFLRFFCPAILNPKLFDLIRDHPRPKAQRTLTLIAKSLQVLANLSTFGQKESWMEPMNRFLSTHRQELKNFIDSITSIPAERNNVALPASYSTPITILGRLPPASREGFPSLPYLIDHAHNFASLIDMWMTSTSTSVPLASLTGDLLTFHNLCVDLQNKRDERVQKAEIHAQDIGSMSSALQWDELVTDFENHEMKSQDLTSALQDSAFSPANGLRTAHFSALGHAPFLPMPARTSTTSPPPDSRSSAETFSGVAATNTSSSGKKAVSRTASESERDKNTSSDREKKERQRFWENTFGKESKYQRPYGGVPDPAGEGSYKSHRSGRTPSPPSRGGSHSDKKEKRDKKEEKREEKERARASGDLKRDKSSNNKDKDSKDKEKQKESKEKGFLGLGIGKKKEKSEKEHERDKKALKISGPIVTSEQPQTRPSTDWLERKDRRNSAGMGGSNSGWDGEHGGMI